jgi:glucokinase
MLLAGDIGGTKTNLAIFSPEEGPYVPVEEATFPSGEYDSLETIVAEFIEQAEHSVEWASFGVAGPVVGSRATITNLPWVIEEDQLEEMLGLETVRLLNDLNAIAHAVPFLKPDDLYALNVGDPEPGENLAVIAPGTGLGEAFLVWDGATFRPSGSEGGHADFAPTTPLQIEMLRYLQGQYDRVSYERVCSGSGIPNIYRFFKDVRNVSEPGWLSEQLAQADDPTPAIVNAALEQEPPEICRLTLEMFVSILGAEAGNLTLKTMGIGGVYLGGGIPPRIITALEDPAFMHNFANKGRFSDMMAKVPVYVICNPKVALLGAACHGLEIRP